MSSYKVIIEGNTLSGFNPEQVRPRLAALVNKSEEIAARLLSGHPSTVKSGVDQATSTRYVNALMQIGVACRVERETLDIDIGEKNSSSDAAAPHGIGTDPAASKEETHATPRADKAPDEKYCTECGAVIKAKAEICPKCGVRQIAVAASRWEVQEPVPVESKKSVATPGKPKYVPAFCPRCRAQVICSGVASKPRIAFDPDHYHIWLVGNSLDNPRPEEGLA